MRLRAEFVHICHPCRCFGDAPRLYTPAMGSLRDRLSLLLLLAAAAYAGNFSWGSIQSTSSYQASLDVRLWAFARLLAC